MNRKEYMKIYLQQWREKNRKWIKVHNKELVDSGYFSKWKKEHKESVFNTQKKIRQIHRVEILAKNKRRQQRLKSLRGFYTKKDWIELKRMYGNRCAFCKKKTKLTKDHIIQIWEKDSTNFIANIRPLCSSCNSSEGAKYQHRKKVALKKINHTSYFIPEKKQRISGKQKPVSSPNKKNSTKKKK